MDHDSRTPAECQGGGIAPPRLPRKSGLDNKLLADLRPPVGGSAMPAGDVARPDAGCRHGRASPPLVTQPDAAAGGPDRRSAAGGPAGKSRPGNPSRGLGGHHRLPQPVRPAGPPGVRIAAVRNFLSSRPLVRVPTRPEAPVCGKSPRRSPLDVVSYSWNRLSFW